MLRRIEAEDEMAGWSGESVEDPDGDLGAQDILDLFDPVRDIPLPESEHWLTDEEHEHRMLIREFYG